MIRRCQTNLTEAEHTSLSCGSTKCVSRVYVLLPAAMACSHGEVSLELNGVQCVSPPRPVTQGTGRLSPANLPVQKREGKNKTKRTFLSAPGHSPARRRLHQAAAGGQSRNDVRRFISMCAKDTFHSVVSCFFLRVCVCLRVCERIVAFQPLALHIDSPG